MILQTGLFYAINGNIVSLALDLPTVAASQVDDHRLLTGSRTAVLPGGFPQPLHIADRWYAEELLVFPVKV